MASKFGRVIVICAGLFFILPGLFADEIRLKNGKVFEGEITEEDGNCLIFRMKAGKVKFSLSDVGSIEKKSLPEDFFSKTESVPSPVNPQEDKDKAMPYDLLVRAFYDRQGDAVIVDVEGDAAFPDGASIELLIARRGVVMASGRTSVFGNKFFMDFKFSKRRLLPSVYTVTAIFIPEKQTEDIKKLLLTNFASGTKARTAESRCLLYAGGMKEILCTEVEFKGRVCSSISKIEASRSELCRMYESSKKKFNAKEWNKWANSWALYLRGLQKKSDARNVLHPGAEDAVIVAANSLLKLQQYCDLEFKNPSVYNKVKNDPNTRINPEVMKKLLDEDGFEELTSYIRKEASITTGAGY
jgi:hypothetical protein